MHAAAAMYGVLFLKCGDLVAEGRQGMMLTTFMLQHCLSCCRQQVEGEMV